MKNYRQNVGFHLSSLLAAGDNVFAIFLFNPEKFPT